LPVDMQARLQRIIELVQLFGLERVHEPHVKHIDGSLWEIRVSGKSGIARALYVTLTGKRVVILRVFVKKSQNTPRREFELPLSRAKEVK
jgi:phage-related protein